MWCNVTFLNREGDKIIKSQQKRKINQRQAQGNVCQVSRSGIRQFQDYNKAYIEITIATAAHTEPLLRQNYRKLTSRIVDFKVQLLMKQPDILKRE